MKHRTRRWCAVLVLPLILALSLYPRVSAAQYDTSEEKAAHLSIEYELAESIKLLPDEQNEILLYRVADIADGSYDLRNHFESLHTKVGDLKTYDPLTVSVNLSEFADNTLYTNAAELLAACRDVVSTSAVKPDAVLEIRDGARENNTQFYLAKADLPYGLYYGTGPSYGNGGKEYTMGSFLISLPFTKKGADGMISMDRDVVLTPKFNSIDPAPELSAVPNNTPTPATATPLVTETPATPFPSATPVPSTQITPNPEPSQSVPPSSSIPTKLPQTGLLWWPVPVFLIAGDTMLIIGWLNRKKSGARK